MIIEKFGDIPGLIMTYADIILNKSFKNSFIFNSVYLTYNISI